MLFAFHRRHKDAVVATYLLSGTLADSQSQGVILSTEAAREGQ
jgi:hypothetical protein